MSTRYRHAFFRKKNIYGNKQRQRCLTSAVIKKMQIQVTVRNPFAPISLAEI